MISLQANDETNAILTGTKTLFFATAVLCSACAPYEQVGAPEMLDDAPEMLNACVPAVDGWTIRRQIVGDVSFGIASIDNHEVKYHVSEGPGDTEIARGQAGESGLRRAKWPDGEDSLVAEVSDGGTRLFIFAFLQSGDSGSEALASKFLDSVEDCRKRPTDGVPL